MDNYFEKVELLPCIVQSAKDGEVLMLGYMNKEAFEMTLHSGFVTFYSRSRSALWTKGETSGNKIELVSLYHDCDKDTFLIKGREWGPTCHTGVRSCFQKGQLFSKIDDSVPDEFLVPSSCSGQVLTQLFERIENRRGNPVQGSYTNYLFTKGVDKICKKIGEESAEVIIAAKTEGGEVDLLNEAGDLLYHLLVLLAEKKLRVTDLYEVLEKRLKIQGNLKE